MTQTLFFSTHEAARKWAEDRDLSVIPKFITTGDGEEPGYWANNQHNYITKAFLVVRPRKFWIQERIAGNRITWHETLEEARAELAEFERRDKADNVYEQFFYEIVEDQETEYQDLPRYRPIK